LTLNALGGSATFNTSPGEAADSTGADLMVFPFLNSKTTAAWAVGNGSGSLDFFSIAANTWYHAYLIKRPDTGVTDILTSLAPGTSQPFTVTIASPTVVTQSLHGLQINAPWTPTTTGALPTGLVAGTTYFVRTVIDANTFTIAATGGGTAVSTSGSQSGTHTGTSNPILPASYMLFRRIGALKTDSSSHWLAFTQYGDNFIWAATVQEIDTTAPATALTPLSLVGSPPGIACIAHIRGIYNSSTASAELLAASGDETTALDGNTAGRNRNVVVAVANIAVGFQADLQTNTSPQIKYQVSSAAGAVVHIDTFGWIDRRGRDF
jgi:hypothetical protein